jgi:hypothetical protein
MEMMRRTGVEPSHVDVTLPYRKLDILCAQLGVAYHYPIDTFRAEAAKDTLFFDHDAHPNAQANALVASLLRDVLAPWVAHAGR